MSSILTCRSISKAFGAQHLFSDLDFVINSEDRIGLIGPNGSGKSTLLKIISGIEDEDSGVIEKRSNLIISYLAQEDLFQDELTPLDNLLEPLASSPLPYEQKLNRAQAMLSRIELIDVETQEHRRLWFTRRDRRKYQERFELFLKEIEHSCKSRQIDYQRWRTDLPFEEPFLELLSRGSALASGS